MWIRNPIWSARVNFWTKATAVIFILLDSLNGNLNMSDASFVFDKSKHPGVEEVNLTQ